MLPSPIKHILVATDFSVCASAAYPTAIALQKRFGARLTLVAVIPPGETESLQGHHSIESVRKSHFAEAPVQTALVTDGSKTSTELVRYATSHCADLIVLASHGRTGLERVLIGSVAEDVLRSARCPVLVIPYHSRKQSPDHERIHIVVTTDFSPRSERAFPIARAFLNAYGSDEARVTILHASENILAATFDSALGGSREEIRRETEAEAERQMEALHAKYFAGTLAMTAVVRCYDTVHREIIAFADGHEADLIIVSSRGHSTVEEMFLGNISEKLVRTAKRPVLVVPARDYPR